MTNKRDAKKTRNSQARDKITNRFFSAEEFKSSGLLMRQLPEIV